jgi:LysM repeat protein
MGASRFVTFHAEGIASVKVMLGDGPVVVSGGFGGWDVVSRPRRTALTVWQGYDPLRLTVPVIFNAFGPGNLTLNEDQADPQGVESKIRTLGLMAGRGYPLPKAASSHGHVKHYTVKKGDTLAKIAHHLKVSATDLLRLNRDKIKDPSKLKVHTRLRVPTKTHTPAFGEPPVVTVQSDAALIPYNEPFIDKDGKLDEKEWVIENIEFADAILNRDGYRVRQFATVSLMQFVPTKALQSQATPWRRTKLHSSHSDSGRHGIELF